MKTQKAYRQSVVLMLPLLLLVVGCDTGGGMGPDDFSPAGAYRIDCFVPDGTTQMVFEANGALEDKGTIKGYPLPSDENSSTRVIYREFEGEQGYMALRVEVSPGYGSHVSEGTFTFLGGNGVYARLQQKGDFYAVMDDQGEVVEVFSGRLVARDQ